MNKTILLIATAIIGCIIPTRTNAQILIPPALPDIYWYSANPTSIMPYIAGLNTAMIDFPSDEWQCPGIPRFYNTLMASDYFGNATSGGISVRDACTGFTVNIPYPITPGGNWMTNSPDIIIGNNLASPRTDYIVAAAFVNNVGSYQIDYWRVNYFAPFIFAVTFMSTTIIAVPMPAAGTVHLDVIAEASNTLLTTLPWCDKFVVTFDDIAGNVYAAQASLNAPPPLITPASSTLINPGAPGSQPDVAAIQRNVSGPIHDMALITWTDGLTMYYNEWDITAVSIAVPTPLQNVFPATIRMPRIDAPDDHTINTPIASVFPGIPTSGFSYYKIAAEVSGMSWTWDNYMDPLGLGPSWDNASFVPAVGPHHSPTVAFGPNGGTQYAVSHYTNGGPTNNVYMEPIDWTNPYSLALSPLPFSALDYFRVNTAPAVNGLWSYQNAISTPCNNPADRTLVAWAVFNNLTLGYDVYYKLTDYNGASPNGYAFKTANVSAVTRQGWDAYPNPADAELTVTAPHSNAQYRISDMLGRVVQSGSFAEGKQQIGVSDLAPGSYILHAVANGEPVYHTIFVKQ